MQTMTLLSTGVIDNRAPTTGSTRPIQTMVIHVANNQSASVAAMATIEVFLVMPSGSGYASQSTYVLEQVTLNVVNEEGSTYTVDHLFADLDNFGVRCTFLSQEATSSSIPTVTAFGMDALGDVVASFHFSRASR